MAIDNPAAVRFANEKVRVAADRLAQAYYFAKRVKDEWYANVMGDLFPSGGGTVLDRAATDGRHVIDRDDVVLLINRCEDLITDLEANANAKLNTILQVAVNADR